MPDLTILHTNDLHGKLSDRAARTIAGAKASCGRCLLLDAGDAVSSSNIYWRPGGEPILARMSDLGYDAMVMGNREFHFLAGGLRSKVRLARFPVLSANLHSSGTALGPSVVPSVTFELNGLTVAVFGLTVRMITKRMFASRVSPFWFEDPLRTATEIVPALRDASDLVIALTHIGLQADTELAGAVPGIDVIVGGHTHAVLSEPELVGDTAVTQAGWWGHYLGKTEVTLRPGGRPEVCGTLIDLRA